MKKKILITGITGFVGSHLLKALILEKKHWIVAVKRPGSDFPFGENLVKQVMVYDLKRNGENFHEIFITEKPDLVVHLIGYFRAEHKSEEIEEMVNTNVLLGTQLLEAMVQNGVRRFINTGTFWEYYDRKKIYNPVNLYAATKHAFSDILKYYIEAEGLSAVTIQISDTYGLCDRRQKLFNLLKKACVSQASLDMSKGEQYLDLVYIDDVVDAYLKTIEYLLQKDDNSHEIFQIGTGKPKKLKDVVYLFQKIAGKKITVNFGGRPYRKREMMYTKANIGKAKKVLGWRPKISLNRGINILIKENYD